MIPCGVNLLPEVPVTDVVDLAVKAEELGYQRCWVFDEGLATRDLYVTLTAIALATERITFGPGITNPYTRHPATTAAAVATLDELSNGRAFLGVGVGGSLTLDPIGIERSRPLVAVSELIEVCRRLFTGAPVDFEGETATLRSAYLGYGRPELEIWLAGRGPRMIALGGEKADGVMLEFLHKDLIAGAVERVKEGAARSGNQPGLSYGTMVVIDSAGMEATKPHLTYRLVDSTPQVRALLAISDQEVDQIRRAMAGGLRAAAEYVKEEWVYPFVLAGTLSDCRQQMTDLVERHGFDEFVLPLLDPATAFDQLEAVAAMAN